MITSLAQCLLTLVSLGPLLFLFFKKNISHDIPVKIKLHADDCILYSEVESQVDQINLNEAFQRVIRWCDEWQMSVNFKKTFFHENIP